MKRYDNETDDDLRPWPEAAGGAWTDPINEQKTMDADLAVSFALRALRLHRSIVGAAGFFDEAERVFEKAMETE